ncbi:MAG: glycosyltransferase family 2 protein [Victivallales bacterium]|nr:glycosyltransferase family 2 protein [Victivallales bacterium]
MRSRNDEAFVSATLKAILEQKCAFPFEVLCCDDGSTDHTPEILSSFHDRIRRLPRPEGEYHPGRRLNYMIKQSRGEIIVFNNADAIPQNDQWLANLVAPLLDESADAVYGKQVPREDALYLVRKDYQRAFGDGRIASKWRFFFSLATAAARRDDLLAHPFDEEIRYSEDVEWAHRRPIRIVYASEAIVEHSHNYTLCELKRRFYGEGYADGAIFGDSPSLWREMVSATMEVLRDVLFLLKHPCGLKELPMAPVRRFTQKFYHWKGTKDYARRNASA